MRALLLEGETLSETSDPERVASAYVAGATVWVDLGARTDAAERLLAETFHVHPLVIEDIWAERELPKIEDYGEHLQLLVHGVRAGSDPTSFDRVEIDLVLGARLLVTHHDGSRAVAAVWQDVLRTGRLLRKGPVWVLHGVLDHLVDHYIPLLEDLDDEIEKLDSEVMEKAGTPGAPVVLSKMLTFKRTLLSLRRVSFYQREVLLRLSRGDFDEVPPDAAHFFRDVFDHFARVTDLVEGHRDLLAGAIDAYLSVQSNRMNEVMKALTLISTMMLPLTFVVGLYGMNFKFMPELEWRYGYPFALGLMVTIAIGILAWFRHKRWL